MRGTVATWGGRSAGLAGIWGAQARHPWGSDGVAGGCWGPSLGYFPGKGRAVAVLPCVQRLRHPPIAARGRQPRGHMQPSGAARGSGITVEGSGLRLGLGDLRGRRVQSCADLRQALGPTAVGREPKVPDPHEANGKHMEQEAA